MPLHLKKSCFLFFIILTYINSNSQTLFHEIESGKKFEYKNNNYSIDLNWKKDYESKSWNRYGFNLTLNKSLKNNWTIFTGLENYLVVDPKVSNYFEIRPWIMVNLKSKIVSNIYFSQFLKTEWRNFFYDNNYNSDNYFRVRYRFHFDCQVFNKTQKIFIKPGVEWYLLKNISTGERYANSRELYLRFCFEHEKKEWNFGIKNESFFTSIHPEEDNVNTLFLEYKF